jgi:hypothetical protein
MVAPGQRSEFMQQIIQQLITIDWSALIISFFGFVEETFKHVAVVMTIAFVGINYRYILAFIRKSIRPTDRPTDNWRLVCFQIYEKT